MLMANSGPPHGIPEEMLMQHFIGGLEPKSTDFMNAASEGSIMYKIVAKVRTILKKVLDTIQYTGVFDDPPEPTDQPKQKKQVHTLSGASSPPPPHIEEITEPSKSTDHEPLIEDMPMFIPELFTEQEYMELGNASNMPKEHKCTFSRSEAFMSDPGPRGCVHQGVRIGLGDRTCPVPYLYCILPACGVELVDTEGNYSSCTRVRFLS
jgi:hypothetical protein